MNNSVISDGRKSEFFKRVKELTRMQEYLMSTPMPDNYEELLNKRTIKKSILEDDVNDVIMLVGSIVTTHVLHKQKPPKNEEEIDDFVEEIRNKIDQTLDDYPELMPEIREKFVYPHIKNTLTKMIDNERLEKETVTDKATQGIEELKKFGFKTDLEEIIKLFKEAIDSGRFEDSDQATIHVIKTLHIKENHKEKDNGYCEICDAFYGDPNDKDKDRKIRFIERYQSKETQKILEEWTRVHIQWMKIAPNMEFEVLRITNFQNKSKSLTEETLDDFLKVAKLQTEKTKLLIQKHEEENRYFPFTEARKLIQTYNINTKKEYRMAVTKRLPSRFPRFPEQIYAREWKGWIDFLGIEQKDRKKNKITLSKIDEAIKRLKQNWNFYMRQKDGFLLDLFDSWGLFNASDQYKRLFFLNFIQLKQTPEGRAKLMEIISSGRFDMIKGHLTEKADQSAVRTVNVVTKYRQPSDIISMKPTQFLIEEEELGVHKILSEAEDLIPMDPNSKEFKLHVRLIVISLWKEVFDPKKTSSEVSKIKRALPTKNKLKRAVVETFLREYNQVQKIFDKVIFNEYRGYEPNLMQLYGAQKLQKLKCLGNFSSTGSGKTIMAIIGSRVTESKRTLVVCPLNVIRQWAEMTHKCFPLTKISTGDTIPKSDNQNSYHYHILNYDKFSRKLGEKIVKDIQSQPIDMVILDEAQNIKQREENPRMVSKRKKIIEKMIKDLRKRNSDLKVVVLTATPVINNVREGVKLLEMMTGRQMPHLKTRNTLRNASRLYTEFLEYTMRWTPKYNIKKIEEPIYCQSKIPDNMPPETVRELNWNGFERICTKDRIPKIIEVLKKSDGQAIIYTEYVTDIVNMIADAVKKEGFKVGFFTGDDKTGLVKPTGIKGEFTNPFLNGDIDVLIASSPIAEGIDGLQKVCNKLIFNGLPWTYAKFEQIVGRLVRTGQTESNVHLYLMLSRIEDYDYDIKIKKDRIHKKEMLQMCIIDGYIPDMSAFKNDSKLRQEMVENIIKERNSRLPTKNELIVRQMTGELNKQ